MQCTIQMKSLYKSKANAHYLKRTKVGISFSIVLSQSMKRKKFKWNFAFTPTLTVTVTLTFPVEFYIYCSSYGLHFYTSQMEILQSMKDSFFCNLYWGLLTEVVVVSNALVSNKFLKAHIFDAALNIYLVIFLLLFIDLSQMWRGFSHWFGEPHNVNIYFFLSSINENFQFPRLDF